MKKTRFLNVIQSNYRIPFTNYLKNSSSLPFTLAIRNTAKRKRKTAKHGWQKEVQASSIPLRLRFLPGSKIGKTMTRDEAVGIIHDDFCSWCVCVCVCRMYHSANRSTSTRTFPASITTLVWLIHPSDWLPVQRGPGVSQLTGVVCSCSRSRSPSPRRHKC